MADTTFVNLVENEWVLALAASKTATISIQSGNDAVWVEAAAPPANTVNKGHPLRPGELITRTTGVGQEIYIFARGKGHVAVTE